MFVKAHEKKTDGLYFTVTHYITFFSCVKLELNLASDSFLHTKEFHNMITLRDHIITYLFTDRICCPVPLVHISVAGAIGTAAPYNNVKWQ